MDPSKPGLLARLVLQELCLVALAPGHKLFANLPLPKTLLPNRNTPKLKANITAIDHKHTVNILIINQYKLRFNVASCSTSVLNSLGYSATPGWSICDANPPATSSVPGGTMVWKTGKGFEDSSCVKVIR